MQRDYNQELKDAEGHRYAYDFDLSVMHPFMIRSFKPFFIHGSVLELGSFKGFFTRHLLDHFKNVTCVEASDEAISEAQAALGNGLNYVLGRFEDVVLEEKYENIIITHVLEHLDDPVAVLSKALTKWLKPGGRVFVACPNANAASRQIAVKMGLISHNQAISKAESVHGHRITYSLDTLERDVVAAGHKVIHRGGIFFKALANFQWDRLLQTDIISPAFLEGCYKVGHIYPDLCSSIFTVSEHS
jgi:2-polyprenyl-3-methyl-5-hydroxy-6-metoxy-1,4-benzoquinol methylase